MRRTALALAALVGLLLVSGCISGGGDSDGMTIISDGSVIDASVCAQKGIADKVVVFHSPTCPACKATLPVLEDLETKVDAEFVYIDLLNDKEKAEELGIMPTHIPTIVIKCKAYTGQRTEEEFRGLIEG